MYAPQVLLSAPRDTVWRVDSPGSFSVLVEDSVSLDEILLREMDRELRRIFKPSDATVDIVLPHERNAHAVFDTEVIVMRVAGRCEFGPMPPLKVHRADALGRTFVTDGVILPFVELDCRQISGALRSRLAAASADRRPAILGRAIARVLAHEIYHVLARTSSHSAHGIAAETMSVNKMVADHLDFCYEDFEEMRLASPMATH